MSFKLFIEQEEDQNILDMLKKLPTSHSNLVKDYTFKLKPGNTLDGDDEHVGYVDKAPKEIVIASPWNYGREFTTLHEIGHLIWEKMESDLQDKWIKIVNNTDIEDRQNPEELFCMAYAQFYCTNKLKKYDFPAWMHFISQLRKNNEF